MAPRDELTPTEVLRAGGRRPNAWRPGANPPVGAASPGDAAKRAGDPRPPPDEGIDTAVSAVEPTPATTGPADPSRPAGTNTAVAVAWPTPEVMPGRRRSIGWWATRSAIGAIGAWVLVVAAQIVAYRWIDPPGSMLMLGRALTGQPYERRWVPIERVSEQIIRAVIVSEDGKFCRHHGVDWGELKAAIADTRDGFPRGGSTISMQVAKNLFLWPGRDPLRKALELPIALGLDGLWPKRRVLEIYLNIAEWGPDTFGVEAAAHQSFQKSARGIDAHEAALLATALPSPHSREPADPTDLHVKLADRLMQRMATSVSTARCVIDRRASLRSGGWPGSVASPGTARTGHPEIGAGLAIP